MVHKIIKLGLAFILSIPVMSGISFAQKVNVNKARQAANSFVSQYAPDNINNEIKGVGDLVKASTYKNTVTYYVFNVVNGGFVIISADQSVFPLLGYSFENNFSLENASPEFSWWMRQYEEQIFNSVSDKIPAGVSASNAWNDLLAGRQIQSFESKGMKSMAPLLRSTWDQGIFYNMVCPIDTAGPGGHVWSGCVATCMAQTMYYYRFPLQGTGSHGYTSDYGYLFADFANTTYDWNAMQDNIGNYYNSEMSKIQYHCGIAVDMMYSPDGSGAYMEDAVNAMINNFGYNPGGQLYNRYNYSDSQWKSMLRSNLDNKWPVIYSGHGPDGGHAFVCDGYQNSDYFHFNWGWSGAFDGYFYLDNLNPGYTFNSGQQAGLDLYPATQYPYYCSGSKTLTGVRGSVEDGSGPIENYQANADCYWLIAPSEPTQSIILEFRDFITEAGNDVVTVYDGASTSDSVLGVFSGNTIPATIQSTGNKMLIRFVSDNANNASGWFASYRTVKYQFCDFMMELTEPAGSFSDGSDINNYNNNTICHWRIRPPGAHAITLNFTSLDIEAGNDMVKVYNESTNTEVAEWTGNTLPTSMTIYTGKVLITFVTNSLNTGAGWDANYTSSTSAVEGTNMNSGMLIYPNPANDIINVSGIAAESGVLNISLFDSRGMEVLSSVTNPAISGQFAATIDISGLASGIYFMKLQSALGTSHYKIVVK
ncbi:MAG: C10 family peptidase [Bacteroidota bacterium]